MKTLTFYNLFNYAVCTKDDLYDAFEFEDCTLLQNIGRLQKGTNCEVYIDIFNHEARFYVENIEDVITYRLNIEVDSTKEIESKIY